MFSRHALAYVWRSAGVARRACRWAAPTRYAEIVPVCAASTCRALSITAALSLRCLRRVDNQCIACALLARIMTDV